MASGSLILPAHMTIGNNAIAVPQYYFKVIFDISPLTFKMIAFVLPNRYSRHPVKSFAVTVDQVEELTGLDFFSELPDIIEDKLENEVIFEKWER